MFIAMNDSLKKILIFVSIAVLVVIMIWPSSVLKIKDVIDGNTVVLNNGATIRLYGVSSTNQAKEELELLKGYEVDLVPDASSYFDKERLSKGSVIYAYILLPDEDYQCLNSLIIKQGKANVVENCVDSIKAFKRYAQMRGNGGNTTPITPTPVDPIDYSKDEIVLPQYVADPERKHSAWFNDGSMNLEMLEEACDYNLPYTKKFANELAARSPGSFNPGQICEIFDYCYNKWRYVNDPIDTEYVARASETISNSLIGDCDDFAILMASCLLAVGGRPCLNTGTNYSGGHAFTEVDIAGFDESDVLRAVREHFSEYDITTLNYRVDGQHKWMNLDWQAAHPGGAYYDCSSGRDTYPYENGKWSWKKIN